MKNMKYVSEKNEHRLTYYIIIVFQRAVYYAQFPGKLSILKKKELIPASLFHLRVADILIGD